MPLPEKLRSMKDELRAYSFWKAVRCEFLVTLLYVFIGCGSTLVWDDDHDDVGDEVSHTSLSVVAGDNLNVKVALTFGLALATFTQCVGHISGAHVNPAVSIAMLVTRNITTLRAFFYMVAQCVGAIAGAGILYGLTPAKAHGHLGATIVHKDVDRGQAFGVEFMITFILVFTFFANLDVKRADMGSRSLSIGLSVTLGHLYAYQYTGASLNPARSLGPALVMRKWHDHWVYWIGPMMGGIIGGFTYEYTHDSSNQIQYFKRSFRRKKKQRPVLNLSHSTISDNSVSTELTFTPTGASPAPDELQI